MKTARNRNRVDIDDAALTMAIAVLVERIRSLPEEDKQDLFEISKALTTAETEEELQSAIGAYREILDQEKGHVESLLVEDEPIGLERWITFVSVRIKAAREKAGMTQAELEDATGLPQSHISRLENGVHSPSASTLEKIAKATGRPLSYFDPNQSDLPDDLE